MEALTATGIAYTCKTEDLNQRNAWDQGRTGSLGLRPKLVTEIFVAKEDADRARQVVRGL